MRLFRIGLVAAVMAAGALPFLLAQVVEEDVEVVIGKADTAKNQLDRARKAQFEDRDYPAAVAAYEDLVARFPDSAEAPEALSGIANIHHLNHFDPETAVPAYERLITAFPTSSYAEEARVRIGQCRARMGEYEAAVEECDRLLDEHPASAHVPLALVTKGSLLLFDLHDRHAAAALYSTLVEAHPETPQADQARIWQTHMRQKRILRPGDDEGPDVVPTMDPADELAKLAEYRAVLDGSEDYHTRATAQYMIGFSHYLQADLEGAVREAQLLLTEYPDASGDQLAQAHYFIGAMYERMGRYAAAAQSYTISSTRYPSNLREDIAERGAARARQKAGRASQ